MHENRLPADIEPEEARPPRFGLPRGVTDCHFHIFGSREKYPLSPKRLFDPVLAPVSRYERMATVLGVERAVVVTASTYGTDNSCTLDAIAELAMPARGIAVISADVSERELERLYAGGIRGVRINFITGRTRVSDLTAIAARIKPFNMHVQLWIRSDEYATIQRLLDRIDVPLVIDHMGQIDAGLGTKHPHFQTLLEMLASDKVWIKLIGYRISRGPPYDDLEEIAAQFLDLAEDRCVWGTDWPHPFLGHHPMPNDGDLIDVLCTWCNASQLGKVLVSNPSRLYGFA